MRASQQLSTPLDISGVLFEAIRGWVSHKALRRVQEQRQLVSKPLIQPCTGTFASSYGLPCVHALKKLDEDGQALLLKHFHPHWHLKRDITQPQPILEPRIAPTRSSVRSNRPLSSTRRDPSGFEAFEAEGRPRAQPKCSRCHTQGHTMTSKACPLRYDELLRSSKSVQPELRTEVLSTTLPAALEITTVRVVDGQIETLQTGQNQTIVENMAEERTALLKEKVDFAVTDRSISGQEPLDSITVDQTWSIQTTTVDTREAASNPAQVPKMRYNDPQAIYQRYVVARETWYKAQPHGIIKTNQQYRRAMGLPQRYDKAAYQWCLDWKQMNKYCKIQGGVRDWTKEEMMAYLDWDKAEEDRVEAQVAAQMRDSSFSGRRGMGEIWDAAARDIAEQEAVFSMNK